MSTNQMIQNGKGNQVVTASTVVKEPKITDQVQDELTRLMVAGRLNLPEDYSASNALSSAWLMLQDVETKVVQGLNPMKKQCYFIAYGDGLSLQRSYFGDMLVAQRVKPGLQFYFNSIHEGDTISIGNVRSSSGALIKVIKSHDEKFPRSETIIGAYCGAVLNGEDQGCTVFDMDRIKKSWSKSKTANFDNATHKIYPAEMAIRTVCRHFCKAIINSSSDHELLEAITRQDLDAVEAEIEEETSRYANRQIVDVTPPRQIQQPVDNGYREAEDGEESNGNGQSGDDRRELAGVGAGSGADEALNF
jgi:recombination protein RecT